MSQGFRVIERNCPAGTRGLLMLLVMAVGLLARRAAVHRAVGFRSWCQRRRQTATATATPVPFAPAKAVPLAVTSDPNLPHWFILVNGSSVPSPMALFTPAVLTVNGTGPAGSPNPNSGTSVGVTPMTFVPTRWRSRTVSGADRGAFYITGAQVWQAVPGTQPGYYYLRNGESFTADRTNNPVGSLMLGYGATEAVLELGICRAGRRRFTWTSRPRRPGTTAAFSSGRMTSARRSSPIATAGSFITARPLQEWEAEPRRRGTSGTRCLITNWRR